MMYNDTLKKILQNSKPEPTPAFADNVRAVLANLPERKKKTGSARWLPKLAVAVAAVAVAGFLAFHFGALDWLVHPAPAQEQFAGMPSLSDSRLANTRIAPCKNNGITEWISYACLDDGIMYLIVTVDPMPKDGRVYMQDVTVRIDGISYHIRDNTTFNHAVGDSFPAGRISGRTERVEIDGFVESYDPVPESAWPTPDANGNFPADYKEPYTDPGTRLGTFHHEFNVDVQGKEREIKAVGSGEIADAVDPKLTHVYETKDLLTFEFSLKDDANHDLANFIDKFKRFDTEKYDKASDTLTMSALIYKGKMTDISTQPGGEYPLFPKYQGRLRRNTDGTFTLTIYMDTSFDVDLKQGITFATIHTAADNTQETSLKYYFVKQPGN